MNGIKASSEKGSVQFSRSVVSKSLRPYGLQHARLPCPSPTLRVYPNSCPLSRWCHQPSHPLSSPFPSALNLFQYQGLFKCQLFALGGQSIGVSASTSVLLMNTQDGSPLGWTGWISLQRSPGDSQESSPTPQFRIINSLALTFLYSPTLTSIHDYWENHSLD